MYIKLLKETYCAERKKLEEMEVFKQEGKMRLLKLRRDIANEIERLLKIPEILGRTDISEEIKENFIRDNEDKIREYTEKAVEEEMASVEKEEKEEMRNVRYTAQEYALYLFQLEKVAALEGELGACRLFPDDVYAQGDSAAEEK